MKTTSSEPTLLLEYLRAVARQLWRMTDSLTMRLLVVLSAAYNFGAGNPVLGQRWWSPVMAVVGGLAILDGWGAGPPKDHREKF